MMWGLFWMMCAVGNLQHFLYEGLGRPRALNWLLPVSESPWEHTKLMFWPLGAGLGLAARLTGAGAGAFVQAWALSALHGFCTMLGIYYLYRAALGVSRPVLWADIGNYFITMLCAWPMGLGALHTGPSLWTAPAAAFLLGAAGLFWRAAEGPPRPYPMFREENTNGRDQRSGSS